MKSFYQRLKEMDRTEFEVFCFHLIKECFPTGDVKRVDGESGDDGADTFTGSLALGPTVWQAKAFSGRIGKSQKDQIRASLKRALVKLKPRKWVLCLNVEMDIKTHRWWERYVESHSVNVRIELWSASKIVSELIHRKSLSQAYFSGAYIDVSELRSLVMKTSSMSDSHLSDLAQETSEQMIERLKKRDARFNYQLVISPENNPVASPPGSTFSITTGRTTIHALPRDLSALMLDPPKFSFKLKGTGAEKMLTFLETGHPQVFERGEVGSITTTFTAFDLDQSAPMRLSIDMVAAVKERVIPMRLTFGSGSNRVIYEYLPFRLTNAGSKEMTIVSDEISSEPFRMTARLRGKDGNFTFDEKEIGFPVRSGDKWIKCVDLLKKNGRFEFYDLSAGKPILSGKLSVDFGASHLSQYAAFFSEATELCDGYDVELVLRRPMNDADLYAFEFLQKLMVEGTIELQPFTSITTKLAINESLPAEVWTGEPIAMDLAHDGHTFSLLDTNVNTGAFRMSMNVQLQDAEKLHPMWESAPCGASFETTWLAIGPVHLTRINPDGQGPSRG